MWRNTEEVGLLFLNRSLPPANLLSRLLFALRAAYTRAIRLYGSKQLHMSEFGNLQDRGVLKLKL